MFVLFESRSYSYDPSIHFSPLLLDEVETPTTTAGFRNIALALATAGTSEIAGGVNNSTAIAWKRNRRVNNVSRDASNIMEALVPS